MQLLYKNGILSVILRVKILDSRVAFKQGLKSLAFNTAGLIISTIANNEASATAYTQAGSTIETIATIGTFAAPTASKCRFKEVDATNHPGIYEIQIADARWAVSGARHVTVSISGAANMVENDTLVQLTNGGAEIDVNAAKANGGSWPANFNSMLLTTWGGMYIGGIGQITLQQGNVAGASTNSITLDGNASNFDDANNGNIILTSDNQSKIVTDYTGNTTVSNIAGAYASGHVPTAGMKYAVWPLGAVPNDQVLDDSDKQEILDEIDTRLPASSAPLDAAATRAAIGIASPNLDVQLGNLASGQTSIANGVLGVGNTTTTINAKLGSPSDASVSADIAALATGIAGIGTNVTAVYNRIGAPAGASIAADIAAANTAVGGINAYFTINRPEPGKGQPPGNTTFLIKLDYLFKEAVNKSDVDSVAGVKRQYAGDGSTVDQQRTVTSSGNTTTIGAVQSGP